MGKIQSNIRFGRKNGSYDFKKTDNGVQKTAFKKNAAADIIFKKYDRDNNNILDAQELAKMNQNIQDAASKHNSKNMGKKEAANFLGADYEGTNAQQDILNFLNTIGSSADTVQSAFTQNGITTVKYNPENNSQLTEIYKNNGEKSILNSKTITNTSDNSTTEIMYDETGENPVSKTIKKGSITIEVDPKTDRPLRQITDKGSGIQEIIEYTYDDEKGTVTETTKNQDGTVISTIVKDKNGNEIKPKEKIEETKPEEQKSDDTNKRTIIVQNGESLTAIAKKFGCNVEELKELNKDQLKGKGKNQYFDVGAEIKLPDSVTEEQYKKASEGRKPAEMAKKEYEHAAEIRRQKAEAQKQEQEYFRKEHGVKSFNNKGQKVKAELSGGKKVDAEIIGQTGYGRQIVKIGKKFYTISHDNKVLKEEYIDAHKAFVSKPKNEKNNTASGIDGVTYVKDKNGKVWYFDEKTGKAIVKGDYAKIVKQESSFVANQLHTAAKGVLTDNKLLEKGIKNIYSSDILHGVNSELKAKDVDYAGDANTMPVEALILDENNHKSARPLFKTLINSGAMSTKEIANTVKREMDYEIKGDGNIGRAFTHFEFGTGYTSTENLGEIMQMATDRNVRLEIENMYKNEGVEPDSSGSYVRTALKNDGWNAQEVDQFDANWIKSGAYSEAKIVGYDEKGEPIIEWGDQQHRNDVIQRLVFGYNDKEALNKGLDACNDDPNSSDYRSLNDRAEEVIANNPKYDARFTGQDNIQRYLAGFHSDSAGNVNAGEISASNTCLFKSVKPARIQAEEALYKAKQNDFSQAFDSTESETYAAMAELIANGDVEGVKSMKELYDKAYESSKDKVKVKANAMISGQVKFSDKEIADFCVELMHSIDKNKGFANSENTVGTSGGSVSNGLKGALNVADYQTEQLKAILQANPQVLATVKKSVENGNFEEVTNKTVALRSDTYKQDTKQKYLDIINDTKIISDDAVFLDKNGNKITDEAQINAIKDANMRSLDEMRKYVAELEREFKKGVDSEGALSNAANSLSEASGWGTDRGDVANRYRQAKLMLNQFEAAAQGKLRDSQGNVISAQDLAKQISSEQEQLAQTNSDYKETIAYGKMGIVLAPVIVATAGAGASVAALGGGTMAVAAGSGVAAGATTYGVNALEYNTSYTGDTAEARERNLQDSAIAAGTTAIGIGQMKYIGNMANNLGTVARTGVRLATTVGADTLVGAGAEGITTGDVSAQGLISNGLMSGVGNVIGAKSLGRKQPVNVPHQKGGVHVTQDAPITGRNEIADAEVARNIDQKHLNARERQMIADEMEAQATPTEAELKVYHEENAFKPVSDEDMPAYQAHQEQVAKDYAEAHRIENNAKITHENAPKASVNNTEVTALENEIGALDGQIKRLNQQLAGAKRANQMGRKNGDTIKKLENQIEALNEKRTAKASELETAKKPAETATPEKVESQPDVVETPQVEVKPEKIINDVNSINISEIPPQHQNLWKNCKERISQITDELMNFKGDIDAMLLKCNNLFSDLREIANNASIKVKEQIEKIINNLQSMLNPQKLSNLSKNETPIITSKQKMEMAQIANSINGAKKNLDNLNKLQAWLDRMPECQQKSLLQNQLKHQYQQIGTHTNFSGNNIENLKDFSSQTTGTKLPKNEGVILNGNENLRLSNFDLDLSSPEIRAKLQAMNDGDVISVGRSVSGKNDIQIDSNFDTVSGRHLEIKKVGNQFVVTDTSLNGTSIGKSLANVSDEIKSTFGHQTVKNLADLKSGDITTVTKGDIRYTIQNQNGNIQIVQASKTTPTLNKVLKFDEYKMSSRCPSGEANPGKSMGELLTPQQKKVYSDSMDAFERSKNKIIQHNANNILTTDNLLHGTNIDALLDKNGILDNGLVPREISGNSSAHFSDGTVPDTLTPLCSDVWDIRESASIRDYFDGNNSHWQNYGESNFLPNSHQTAAKVVIVFDKNSIDPTIIDNSFGVNNSGRSVLFENGNMSRGHNYPTHRAVPIGMPSNSIDRIIIDTRQVGKSEVKALQKKIQSLGLDIKLYDLQGTQL